MHVTSIKPLPVHHHSAVYIFWSFGNIDFMYNYSENRVLLKPVLGDMAGVAYFITGHEQAEVN